MNRSILATLAALAILAITSAPAMAATPSAPCRNGAVGTSKLVAYGIPCARAVVSFKMMMDKGVQYTRPAHFKFRTHSANWNYRWTCVRRHNYVEGSGPQFPITCTTGSMRITFVLWP